MRLIYFDEKKYRKDNPFFTICGILVREAKMFQLDRAVGCGELANRIVRD